MIEGLTNLTAKDLAAVRDVRNERVRPPSPPAIAPPPEPIDHTPPAEVLELLGAAKGVIEDLDQARIELRFSIEETGARRRVKVEVRDSDGTLLREIPPSRLGLVLAGDSAHGLLVDAMG